MLSLVDARQSLLAAQREALSCVRGNIVVEITGVRREYIVGATMLIDTAQSDQTFGCRF